MTKPYSSHRFIANCFTAGAQEHKDLYDALVKSYKLDKDIFESYGKVFLVKRAREDKDKDEDPLAGSDQGLRKQKTSNDAELSRGSKSKKSKSSSSKDTKSQPKSFGKSQPKSAADTELPLNQGDDVGNTDDQPNVKTNLEGHEYPFDLSKPIPLIKDQCCQVVPANYFINNDLEYLKGGSLSRKYTTSTTKTKAAKYDTIEGIEDMVPSLWSPVKLYKLIEGDFPRLILHDIKDMLLLLVQKKFSNLERDDLFDLNVALWIFTRRAVILKQVKDLLLRVKSYQKKLNITRPEMFRFDISSMTLYTVFNTPQGIIYLDKLQRNKLMRSDKLYKFCDDTLSSVRKVLYDIASSLKIDYLPKRRWSKLDRKRSRIMIMAIDQRFFERRLMTNLEKFVGGREYKEDFRMHKWTI
nr:hypothetical protein [Tanacetum cinerariifolium]